MLLNNYSFTKNKEIYTLILLVLFSVAIRVPIVFIFGDTGLEYEWKTLVENLTEYKQLAWKNCEFAYWITKSCLDDRFLLPNLWMPPLYAYYLYFFTFFNLEEQNYISLILSSQILFASISVAVFYKINKFFFSKKLSLFSSLLFSQPIEKKNKEIILLKKFAKIWRIFGYLHTHVKGKEKTTKN